MPATLSTASTRPNCSTAALITASTSASWVTSQCTGRTLAPSAAAVSFSPPLMSAATTLAPSRTNTLHDALPMPDPAPVITATLPSNSPIGDALHLVRDSARRRESTPRTMTPIYSLSKCTAPRRTRPSNTAGAPARLPGEAVAARIRLSLPEDEHGGSDPGQDGDRGHRPD